jgi:hypothetical protein
VPSARVIAWLPVTSSFGGFNGTARRGHPAFRPEAVPATLRPARSKLATRTDASKGGAARARGSRCKSRCRRGESISRLVLFRTRVPARLLVSSAPVFRDHRAKPHGEQERGCGGGSA